MKIREDDYMKKHIAWFFILLLVAAVSGCDMGQTAKPDAAEGTVTGPITGGTKGGPFTATQVNLDEYGYIEEEFFLEGEATAYEAAGELGIDGVWNAVPAEKAPYKTRLLVRRPTNPEAFNGTVVVEWLNVTGGLDADIGFIYAWAELLRGGYGYVGVSVQQIGVSGANGPLSLATPLTKWDPERYGSLHHPGDLFCYDIFTQAGFAISHPGEIDPMQGLDVEHVIAHGQSQSAMRMITYVNAVHPLSNVFDGFFIQSRAGWGASIGSEGDPLLGNGKPVRVREDIDARVLQFFTETELFLALGPSFAARQPDNEHLRTWEVAGAAHVDQYVLGNAGNINNGQAHVVVKAGIRAMHNWLTEGKAPPKGEPIAVNERQNAIARDGHGNALGGIRTPAVDAPVAALSGTGQGLIGALIGLAGSTVPFPSSTLHELYPTHQDYVDKVTESAHAAREAGFMLPEEEAEIIAEAMAAPIPE